MSEIILNPQNKMNIFCINLERRPDRKKEFLERCPLEDVIFFNAVDGTQLENEKPQDEKEEILLTKTGRSMRSRGECGCSLSHYRVWKKIVQENLPYAIIYEDDAFFTDNYISKLQEGIRLIDMENTDFVYIGGTPYKNALDKIVTYVSSNGRGMKFIPKVSYHKKIHLKKCFLTNDSRTTHAYIITQKGAKKLANSFLKDTLRPYRPIDEWMVIQTRNSTTYDLIPHVNWSPLDYKTDIQIQ